MEQLKIYVINLARSTERKKRIASRLGELACGFEFFDAVDGSVKPHTLFKRYDDEIRKRYRRRVLSDGELGAWASHFLLWEKCVELGEPIVIMEDDIAISSDFLAALNIAKNLVSEIGYIRFAATTKRKFKVMQVFDGFKLVRYMHGPTGALCYVLSPSGAKKLLKFAECWYMAVDDYMDRYWVHDVECLALMPFVVGITEQPSTIKRVNGVRHSLAAKLKFEIVKVKDWFARLKYFYCRKKR